MKASEENSLLKTSDFSNSENESTFYSLIPIKENGHKVPLFIVHGADYDILKFK